ncbi:hypothetical protein [Thalassococcus sp. S3]|uniref:hypothetical protein n=1 Tax=Thalassococcus sp. S3 TaxID=2017482 RepID=UPI0010241769|nr:hypothetical protein [Thalassococcus sp. S3]QBF32122.1 hypothetical protein CFI11_12955 [Thalassococcus sp. S3]
MTEFTYSLCIIGGQTAPDDYVVRYRGQTWEVGRVMFYDSGPQQRWQWSTFTYPCANGVAYSLNVALDELKVAIMALPEEARCKHNGPGAGRRRSRPSDFR